MHTKALPKVFAIVLNYNGKETLIDCINSLHGSSYPNLEIVIVDNASTDGSLEAVKKKYSKVHYIVNSKNIGFSAGNNIGIRFALERFADYILLLNNDARIAKKSIADMVVAAEKNPRSGIISPLILSHDRSTVWFSGGKINWLRMRATHTHNRNIKVPTRIDYATGCSIFISKNVFKQIGLFDEKYFLYYEDVDFSYRAKEKGFKIVLIPKARVFHHEHSTLKNSRKTYWLVLSALLFFSTHSPVWIRPWHLLYLSARKMKNFLDCVLKKNTGCVMVREAYRDFSCYGK